jgi:hypothetical protein
MAKYLVAEIGEEGVVRVKSPDVKPGDQIHIPIQSEVIPPKNEDWWTAFQQALAKADQLDFPRRTYDEIINELHEIRE